MGLILLLEIVFGDRPILIFYLNLRRFLLLFLNPRSGKGLLLRLLRCFRDVILDEFVTLLINFVRWIGGLRFLWFRRGGLVDVDFALFSVFIS